MKLAFLYFLHYGILGVPGDKLIDLKWLKLINNLDMFNNYSWGSLIYKEMVKFLCEAYGKYGQNDAPHVQDTYNLISFPLFLGHLFLSITLVYPDC